MPNGRASSTRGTVTRANQLKIAEGVYSLGDKTGGRVRSFLIDDGGDLILIDTLLRRDGKLVHDELERLGRKPSDIKHIILTHVHQSHVGGLHALRAASGAKVYAHEFEADVLAGRRPYDIQPGVGLWPRRPLRLYPYQFAFVLRVRMPAPLEVDQTLRDGDHIGPLNVLHSPGHSRGSLSFWWPERRLLIVGDAVATWPDMMLGWPPINADEKTNRASMGKLCDLSSADVLCVGHGDPVVQGGADTLRDLVAGRRTQSMARQ
jgi:glyoxylase-like metal-dependent hydrolase (beta-lactamase superfamily II)